MPASANGCRNPCSRNCKKGQPQFQLKWETEINGKAFAALLNFRKSEPADRYYLNSYHASLQRSNGEILDQAFYFNKGKGVTAKEAYNLLDSRAVHKELETKEGQPYKAWLQLDFDKRDKHNNHEVRQYHEAYGYDLKESLSRYAIAEMDGGDKEKGLLQSLQKGNLQSVGIEKEGTLSKMFVEANPQFKTINLYDSDLKLIPKQQLAQYEKTGPSEEHKPGLAKKEEEKAKKETVAPGGALKASRGRSKNHTRGV